jgi:hypothetical protein
MQCAQQHIEGNYQRRLWITLRSREKRAQSMIVGGPAWAETDVFDIEAKAEDPATATSQQMLAMLQSLLTERRPDRPEIRVGRHS